MIVNVFAMSHASCGNQATRFLGVVEKMPALGDRRIELEEISQSRGVTPADRFFGDEMSAKWLAIVNSFDAGIGGRQPEIEQVECVAFGAELLDPRGEGAAGEGRFE
jgi:hypothetical protein